MKTTWIVLLLLLLSSCGEKEKVEERSFYPITRVAMNQIEVMDHFWLPRILQIQQAVIPYAFAKCKSEGRMDNFIQAGRVMRGEAGMTQGKMPFDDTDLYKIIEGAALTLYTQPNARLDSYLDSVIAVVAQGQEPDGYLTTWRTINPLQPPCDWFEGGARWSRLDISHELYNSGHLFEAAATHHRATGKTNLLAVALKNADLLVEVFGENGLNEIPGHQIVETGLIKLYQITQKESYLRLARRFLELRGDSTKRKLWEADNIQDHLPILQQEEANGHAVRAVYMYAAMTDVAAIYQDSAYTHAINRVWENMVDKKLYLTGGIGARHHNECFGDNYELPNLTAYSETCAAIGSVCWNERMFRLTGEAKYYHLIERTLYNALIAGISLDGMSYFYPNPLECDGEFLFNKEVACTRSPWFDCSCCPTNLIRFIPSIPSLIYAHQQNNLYVNLFVSSSATLQLPTNRIQLTQQTDYPLQGKVSIDVHPENEHPFAIKVRVPSWVLNEVLPSSLYHYVHQRVVDYSVRVNGESLSLPLEKGYITIERKWKEGDRIVLEFPMQVRQVVAHEQLTHLQQCSALEYGPFVYCAEEVDNSTHFESISLNPVDKFSIRQRYGSLGGIQVITQERAKRKATFIPYYAWANRGVTKMKVWFANN